MLFRLLEVLIVLKASRALPETSSEAFDQEMPVQGVAWKDGSFFASDGFLGKFAKSMGTAQGPPTEMVQLPKTQSTPRSEPFLKELNSKDIGREKVDEMVKGIQYVPHLVGEPFPSIDDIDDVYQETYQNLHNKHLPLIRDHTGANTLRLRPWNNAVYNDSKEHSVRYRTSFFQAMQKANINYLIPTFQMSKYHFEKHKLAGMFSDEGLTNDFNNFRSSVNDVGNDPSRGIHGISVRQWSLDLSLDVSDLWSKLPNKKTNLDCNDGGSQFEPVEDRQYEVYKEILQKIRQLTGESQEHPKLEADVMLIPLDINTIDKQDSIHKLGNFVACLTEWFDDYLDGAFKAGTARWLWSFSLPVLPFKNYTSGKFRDCASEEGNCTSYIENHLLKYIRVMVTTIDKVYSPWKSIVMVGTPAMRYDENKGQSHFAEDYGKIDKVSKEKEPIVQTIILRYAYKMYTKLEIEIDGKLVNMAGGLIVDEWMDDWDRGMRGPFLIATTEDQLSCGSRFEHDKVGCSRVFKTPHGEDDAKIFPEYFGIARSYSRWWQHCARPRLDADMKLFDDSSSTRVSHTDIDSQCGSTIPAYTWLWGSFGFFIAASIMTLCFKCKRFAELGERLEALPGKITVKATVGAEPITFLLDGKEGNKAKWVRDGSKKKIYWDDNVWKIEFESYTEKSKDVFQLERYPTTAMFKGSSTQPTLEPEACVDGTWRNKAGQLAVIKGFELTENGDTYAISNLDFGTFEIQDNFGGGRATYVQGNKIEWANGDVSSFVKIPERSEFPLHLQAVPKKDGIESEPVNITPSLRIAEQKKDFSVQVKSKRFGSKAEATCWLTCHLKMQQAIVEKQVRFEKAAVEASLDRQLAIWGVGEKPYEYHVVYNEHSICDAVYPGLKQLLVDESRTYAPRFDAASSIAVEKDTNDLRKLKVTGLPPPPDWIPRQEFEDCVGQVTYTFKHVLGLTCDADGIVTDPFPMEHKGKFAIDDQVLKVNGEKYSEDALKIAQESGDEYSITFKVSVFVWTCKTGSDKDYEDIAIQTVYARCFEGFKEWQKYALKFADAEKLPLVDKQQWDEDDYPSAFAHCVVQRTVESLAEHVANCPERLSFLLHGILHKNTDGSKFVIDLDVLHDGLERMVRNSNPYKDTDVSWDLGDDRTSRRSRKLECGLNFDDINDSGIQKEPKVKKTFQEPKSVMVLIDFLICFRVMFTVKFWGFLFAFYLYLGSSQGSTLTTKCNGSLLFPQHLRITWIVYSGMFDAFMSGFLKLLQMCRRLAQRGWPSDRYYGKSPGAPTYCDLFLSSCSTIFSLGFGCGLWYEATQKKHIPTWCTQGCKNCPETRTIYDMWLPLLYWVLRVIIFLISHRAREHILLPGTSSKNREGVTKWTWRRWEDMKVGMAWVTMIGCCVYIEARMLLPATAGLNWMTQCGLKVSDHGGFVGIPQEFGVCTEKWISSSCVPCVLSVSLVWMLVFFTCLLDIYFVFYLFSALLGVAMGYARSLNNLKFTSCEISFKNEGTPQRAFGRKWEDIWLYMVHDLWRDSLIGKDERNHLAKAIGVDLKKPATLQQYELHMLGEKGENTWNPKPERVQKTFEYNKVDLAFISQKCEVAAERLAFFFKSLEGLDALPYSQDYDEFRGEYDSLTGKNFHHGSIPSLTMIIPTFSETVIQTPDFLLRGDKKKDAMAKKGDGVHTNLDFLIRQFPEEWEHLAVSLNLSVKDLYQEFIANADKSNYVTEVCDWASLRSQTVAKTTIGALKYQMALNAVPEIKRYYKKKEHNQLREVLEVVVHKFKSEGPMGMSYDEKGFIVAVTNGGQAHSFGIKKGDQIMKLNGGDFKKDELDKLDRADFSIQVRKYPDTRSPEDHAELILASQVFGSNSEDRTNDTGVKKLMKKYRHLAFYMVFDYNAQVEKNNKKLAFMVKEFLRKQGHIGEIEWLKYARVKCRWDMHEKNESEWPKEFGNRELDKFDDERLEVVGVLPRKFPLRIGQGDYQTQGKAGNQLNALMFASGHCIQALDCNMGTFIGECFKAPYVLRVFRPPPKQENLDLPRSCVTCRYLGFREYIYTKRDGLVGAKHANSEWTFGTIYQRFLCGLATRMHYGHPDFMDGFWVRNRGGMSKCSPAINLSEDLFAGYNVRMRGEQSPHTDFLEFEKGREASINAAADFFNKCTGGCVASVRSRDTNLLCDRLGILHSLSFYFSSVAFYLSSLAIDIATHLYVALFIAFTLAGITPHDLQALGSAFGSEWVVSMGFVTMFPLALETMLEYGFVKAFIDTIGGFISSIFFFVFLNKNLAQSMKNGIVTGTAKYFATGRPLANQHLSWKDLYLNYNKSHYHPAFVLLSLYCVYSVFVSQGSGGSLPMYLVVMSFGTWFVSPVLFSPYPRVELMYEDFIDFTNFINGISSMKEEDIDEILNQKVPSSLYAYGLSEEINKWLERPLLASSLLLLARILFVSIVIVSVPANILDFVWVFFLVLGVQWLLLLQYLSSQNNVLLFLSMLAWVIAPVLGPLLIGDRAYFPSYLARLPEYFIACGVYIGLMGVAKRFILLLARFVYEARIHKCWCCPVRCLLHGCYQFLICATCPFRWCIRKCGYGHLLFDYKFGTDPQSAKERLKLTIRTVYFYSFDHQLRFFRAYIILLIDFVVSLTLCILDHCFAIGLHSVWLLPWHAAQRRNFYTES